MSTNARNRAWMEVRADALLANARAIQASAGEGVRLVPMVKADAYGLGVADAVRVLDALEPWAFGVATAAEGVQLRELGVTGRVVVVSPPPAADLAVAVEADLQVGVSDVETLEALGEAAACAGGRAAFHVEIDTGMGRAGFDWRSVAEWGPAIQGAVGRGAEWVGCYTHLHSADEGEATVHEQWERFQAVLGALDPPEDALIHMLNSAGALRLPRYAVDAVRPGIFLYGGSAGADLGEPSEVASVHARVVRISDRSAGDTLGYGATYRASGPERWATLAIGYGDGLPRALGNKGSALLHGRRAGIIGRISMDVTVVNITDLPEVSVGDVATLIGTDGGERITVDEVATLADTISYEVLTGFTPRLPRVWVG